MLRTDLQDPLSEEGLLLKVLGVLDEAAALAKDDEDKAMALCGIAYGYLALAGAANYEEDELDDEVKVTVTNNA